MRSGLWTVAAASAATIVAGALAAERTALTVDWIMQGPQLAGYKPEDARWSGDSRRIYFKWKQHTDPALKPLDTYVVGRDGGGLKALSDEEALHAPPVRAALSRDRRNGVYAQDGDIWLYDYSTDVARQLTRTSDAESSPAISADGRRVTFVRSNNLFESSMDGGALVQLTDVRPNGSPPADPKKGTDSQEFLKKEERDILEVVREKARVREEAEARKKKANPRKPFILGARQSVRWMRPTPDRKFVLAGILEEGEDAKRTIVPNFVTESSYTEPINSRMFVGDNPARHRLLVLSVETGEAKWVDPPAPANISDPPAWSEDGTRAVVEVRSLDNKDEWVMALDPDSAKLREIAHNRDDAWVDGPVESFHPGFLKDDREVYFLSERTGFEHLYAVPFEGGQPRALTSGKWEVHDLRLNGDKSKFYLITNEGGPENLNLWSMQANGGARTRITSTPGQHDAVVSRDDRWIADIHSYANKPNELYSMENRPAARETKLTDSPSPDFWTYPWTDPPIVHFRARDGVEVPARLYKGPGWKRGGPAVIFVHGAGYLQNVHKGWSDYFREYMFHHLLMERGYIVLDADYRGSKGYGRDWRTAIYEHMGGKDLDDHVDAARWLIDEQGVDPKRIGIYGGSYGGFITLMAMFTQGDVFAAGAALRPVTDWSHYNHGYTSNILNTPQKDSEAYRRSSPIYFAAGLKGPLLICHGMVDVNVHFQDSVRLAEKLIELRKENWELAPYPAEDHTFQLPADWADEYKRILKLFESNLKK